MPQAISNTSPLLYLYRAGLINWLPNLFSEIWTTSAVSNELKEGLRKGYDVPELSNYNWLHIVNLQVIPSKWLSLDLGAGELTAMTLALENPSRIVLLDDMLARRTAQAAGLSVWGTLKILLEAKTQGLTDKVELHVDALSHSGMWISAEVRRRILALAGEVATSR